MPGRAGGASGASARRDRRRPARDSRAHARIREHAVAIARAALALEIDFSNLTDARPAPSLGS
jgi:hypothetical protein